MRDTNGAIKDWVHQELQNWSRWCWSGAYPHPLPTETCASIEKHYNRTNDEGTDPPERAIMPNIRNAERVQAIWETLPYLPKQVLRAEYPQRNNGRKTACRRLGINEDGYLSALHSACYKIMIGIEGKQ